MVTAHGREMLGQRSETNRRCSTAFWSSPSRLRCCSTRLRRPDATTGWHSATPNHAAPAAQRLAGLRLLLVEDNLNNQQVARELLEDEGATVAIANNGLEAVAGRGAPPTRPSTWC